MRTVTIYLISWDNGHASGIFPLAFTNKQVAQSWGHSWKRDMINADWEPEKRRESREAYQWEIVSEEYYLDLEFAWPGHIYYIYDKPDAPRQAIVKEVRYHHAIKALVNYVVTKLKKS